MEWKTIDLRFLARGPVEPGPHVVLAVVDPDEFQVIVDGFPQRGIHTVRMQVNGFQQRFYLIGVAMALFERNGVAGDRR